MAFGVYLHFPYCLSKCPYCDFASVASEPPHERYARAIARELELRSADAANRTSISLYLGGGTPSLWSPEAAGRAVGAVRSAVPFADDPEVTLEANPGAAEAARFAAFRAAGFNRISIGIQSFDDRVLSRLGRAHTGDEAVAAVKAARDAGFGNLALDLLYGGASQDLALARADAARAVSLSPEHLSCYALTLEHLAVDVPMAKEVRAGRLEVPDDDLQWEFGRAIGEVLCGAGYRRYEISNWARPGREARHNALYWNGGEYLGLGCGACGFLLNDPADPSRGGRRWGNHREPGRYLADVEAGKRPEAWSEDLDAPTLLRERVSMGLRQVAGVDLGQACAELGESAAPLVEAARKLEKQGLAVLEGERVRLTERGLDFHTEAVLAFV
ncbi:MAG TPA: radical SAM family heme chaperone HemW [Myxococcales bacterium]|jgi:oxygen-independent coproporphyrinogen-3 oxidase